MTSKLLGTLLLLLAVTVTSQFEIIPLEAGRLVVEDKFLRRNTCIFKNVELQLTKTAYERNPEMEIIAGISDMKMNSQLNFKFFYKLNCEKSPCIVQFTIERVTPIVSQLFDYELTIDFLIVRGLKILNVNMTNHRQTFFLPEKLEYQHRINQNQGLMKEDVESISWTAVAIPNGFNDLRLTGGVKLTLIKKSNACILEYSSQKENIQWTLDQNFIYYKIVFLPKEYIGRSQNSEFTFFSGFQGTEQTEIQTLHNFDSKMTLFKLPLKAAEDFFDPRPLFSDEKSIDPTAVTSKTAGYLLKIMVGVLVFTLMEVGYLMYRKRLKEQLDLRRQRGPITYTDIVITFSGDTTKNQEVIPEGLEDVSPTHIQSANAIFKTQVSQT